ncbi:hypothetical protein C8A05DRAFT_19009 [Staphylotrichum tortipilum]|uniref:Protein kinase domain-containing protein n=1 Tax=Staphylotrichum tortipilum TaxID=2831512 RepID=A0AAN6MCF8_9PEZI|nr:hypothetical protein C8A05DRAFT_19009 [Staphylotrichum longicolle]
MAATFHLFPCTLGTPTTRSTPSASLSDKGLHSLDANSEIHTLDYSPNRYWLCAAAASSIILDLCVVLGLLGPKLSSIKDDCPQYRLGGRIARSVSRQLVLAVDYLHSMGIAHGGESPSLSLVTAG